MWKIFVLLGIYVAGGIGLPVVQAESVAARHPAIYAGYYEREGNNEKMAMTTGKNHYLRFYPGNRIIRLYIPFPYAKSLSPGTINKAFEQAARVQAKSAYIRDKFGVMQEPVMAHLDTYRWIDEHVMYDCGKPRPCRVEFTKDSLTVVKPGMVLEHKIHYKLVRD